MVMEVPDCDILVPGTKLSLKFWSINVLARRVMPFYYLSLENNCILYKLI